MPGKGSPKRTLRVEATLWEEFGESAAAVDADRAGLLRDFIRWHTGRPGAELPPRPKPKPSA